MSAGVQNIHGGVADQLAVTGVTATLNVGTIGGDARVHIGKLGVDEGLEHPVQILVIALKVRRDRHIGMDHAGAQHLGAAFDAEIAEAEPGEFGLNDAFRSVRHDGKRLLVRVRRIETAAGGKLLREAHRDRFPARRIDPKHGIARRIQTAVVDLPFAVRDLRHGKLAYELILRAIGRTVFGVKGLGQHRVLPRAVVKAFGKEILCIKTALPLVLHEFVFVHVPLSDAAILTRHEIPRTVRILDHNAVNRLRKPVHAAIMGVPSAAVLHRERIVTVLDVGRDIELRNVDAVSAKHLAARITARLVIRGQRQKGVGIHANAVDIAFEKAESDGAKRHAACATHRKMSAQNRKRFGRAYGCADPCGVSEKICLFH